MPKMYTCTFCAETFHKRGALDIHMEEVHYSAHCREFSNNFSDALLQLGKTERLDPPFVRTAWEGSFQTFRQELNGEFAIDPLCLLLALRMPLTSLLTSWSRQLGVFKFQIGLGIMFGKTEDEKEFGFWSKFTKVNEERDIPFVVGDVWQKIEQSIDSFDESGWVIRRVDSVNVKFAKIDR